MTRAVLNHQIDYTYTATWQRSIRKCWRNTHSTIHQQNAWKYRYTINLISTSVKNDKSYFVWDKHDSLSCMKKKITPHGQDHVNWIGGYSIPLIITEEIQSIMSKRKLKTHNQQEIKECVKPFTVEGMRSHPLVKNGCSYVRFVSHDFNFERQTFIFCVSTFKNSV